MSQEKIKKIHLIYGCITALLVLIVAVALIKGCITIYQIGDRPFSRETISAVMRSLAIPGYLCLLTVLGGIILHIALPLQMQKSAAVRSDKDILRRYQGKFAELSAEQQKHAAKESAKRRTYKIVTAVVSALLAVYPILYFADVSHFGVNDLNGDIVRAVLVALIPTAIVLILVYICGRLESASIRQELEIYKENSVRPDKVSHKKTTNPRKLATVRCVILVAAVVLIVMGIFNDGVADVLGKAIRICTECIGLG